MIHDRTMSHGRRRSWAVSTGCALVCVAALVIAGVHPPAASAGEAQPTYVLNATLSLTGGCSVSAIDPIADPGLCPMPPGVPGVDHPVEPLSNIEAVAVDSYGDIYVASVGTEEGQNSFKEGRIDIFSPQGDFISELKDPNGPRSMAVDSEGNLYTEDYVAGEIRRFAPVVYEPQLGNIRYESELESQPFIVADKQYSSVLVNTYDRHVFISSKCPKRAEACVEEYGSAIEGNPLIDSEIGKGVTGIDSSIHIAIDAAHDRLYMTDKECPERSGYCPSPEYVMRVFELTGDHALTNTFRGSSLPAGELDSLMSLAADEGNGHLFVFDNQVVYEFGEHGEYLATLDSGLRGHAPPAEIAVDNGPHSPNGALDSFGRYLFVPAYPETNKSHLFAFGPATECAPEAKAASVEGVTETEASVHATVNPCGLATRYVFQYSTRGRYEEAGGSFVGAATLGEGEIAAGRAGVGVSAPATGLSPGTEYVFRVVARNGQGEDEAKGAFSTYPAFPLAGSCPNESLRVGVSAVLPDCRAYELVTPGDTGGLAPLGLGFSGARFTTRQASPSGDALSFQIQGGTLPGMEGTGGLHGDPYISVRGEDGWSTTVAGPNGVEASGVIPGSHSPDQGYVFWQAEGVGSKVLGGLTDYLRYPDGHSELVGRGDLGTEEQVQSDLIAADGRHVVFTTTNAGGHHSVRLEPDAPEEGTEAIYDRTIDPANGAEATHVVSLLPGNITPASKQNAQYMGGSLDGRGLAFRLETLGPIYLRVADEKTYLAAPAGATFAGVAEGGTRLFYLENGDLYRFDAKTEAVTRFTGSGDVTVVNVSADGNAAYFVSPIAIVAAGKSPDGTEAVSGAENLYVSREGAISFIGTLTVRDVVGEPGNVTIDGLGLWTQALSGLQPGQLAVDPSRTTPDGDVLLFESRATLTGYDPEGHAEVYRYDSKAGALTCLSCNPTGQAASGDASLESVKQDEYSPEPLDAYSLVENLSSDGRRAVFQSTEALVPADTDGVQDVYEWEQDGVGSCRSADGCVYLISSGTSGRPNNGQPNYLYAVSEGGGNVFFSTTDLLLPALDPDETPSIYDARVEGGFPPSPSAAGECLGEACQPMPVALNDPTPASFTFQGAGNLTSPLLARPGKSKAERRAIRAAKLHAALKACRRKARKKKRLACKKHAHKRYGRGRKRKLRHTTTTKGR